MHAARGKETRTASERRRVVRGEPRESAAPVLSLVECAESASRRRQVRVRGLLAETTLGCCVVIRVFTHRGPSFFRAVTVRGAITVVSHRGVDRHNESIRRGWCEVVGIVYMRYQPRVATRAPQVHNE